MNRLNSKTLLILSFLITILALFYKRPDAFTNSQFWSEEGSVFFAEAYHQGYTSLFNTCTGYFHLYPRLVFCISLTLGIPLQFMPIVSCYAWLLIMLLVLTYLWARLELNATLKFYLAITLILIPLQAEILMNLTNVQWIMALFPIIIFSSTDPDKNKKWFWLDIFILILAGFTGPNFVILLPVLLLLAFLKRKSLFKDRQASTHLAMIVFIAVIDIISLSKFGSIDRSHGEFAVSNPNFIEYLYLQYAFLFLGVIAFDTPWILKCLILTILFAYCLYFSFKVYKGKEQDLFTIITFYTGLSFLLANLISYRHDPAILHPHYGAARNFYLPAICCIWFFISVVASLQNHIAIIGLLMLLFICENIRSIGTQKLDELNWSTYAKKIKTADTLSIPINPPGWHIFIDNSSKK